MSQTPTLIYTPLRYCCFQTWCYGLAPCLLGRYDVYQLWHFLPWPYLFLLDWNWSLPFTSSQVTPGISLISVQICTCCWQAFHIGNRAVLHRSVSPDKRSLVDGTRFSPWILAWLWSPTQHKKSVSSPNLQTPKNCEDSWSTGWQTMLQNDLKSSWNSKLQTHF